MHDDCSVEFTFNYKLFPTIFANFAQVWEERFFCVSIRTQINFKIFHKMFACFVNALNCSLFIFILIPAHRSVVWRAATHARVSFMALCDDSAAGM